MTAPTRIIKRISAYVAIIGALVPLAGQVALADQPEFRADVRLGVAYDSNVSVDVVDENIVKGDDVFTTEANLSYLQPLAEDTQLKLQAMRVEKNYDTFDEFDLAINTVSAQISHDFGQFKLGISGRHIAADLDSSDFMSLNQVSIFASRRINRRVFLRGSYRYSDKELDSYNERSGTRNSLKLDAYYFLRGSKRYWQLAYRFDDEDAVADRFDRDSHRLQARYVHKFDLVGKELTARLKARYQLRDYDSITPSLGEPRNDDRYRFGAQLEVALTPSWFLTFNYERSDYQSNQPSADYTQDLFSVEAGWRYRSQH